MYDGLPAPKEEYAGILQRFGEYFSDRSSVLLRRKTFLEARQLQAESATEYACRLRRLVKECSFGANIAATLLRDMFVMGIFAKALGEKLLSLDDTKLTFDKAVQMAEAFERARADRLAVDGDGQAISETVSAMTHRRNKPPVSFRNRNHVSGSKTSPPASRVNQSGKTTPQCYRCGSTEHRADNTACRTRN